MADAADLGLAVKLQPRRAIAYFKAKGYAVSWNWWDTWGEAHAKSFTVAKAGKLDVLQSIGGALAAHLDKGGVERTFIKTMEPVLKRLGWWGRQFVVNARGEAESVQLGSPHRLKTLFRTNMNTSYAAARERQQRDDTDNRPYWQYLSMADGLTRPSHAALEGQIFRHDDPVWDTHYPPNGFNCRCRVRALTAKQVKDRGLKVQTGKGRLSAVEQEAGVDKQTGEVITRPGTAYRGVDRGGNPFTLTPDPGFSYNPGREWPIFDAKGNVPDAVSRLVNDQRAFRDFALPPLADTLPGLRLPAPALLGKADGAGAALAQLETALALPKRGWRRVAAPEGLDDVILHRDYLPHIVEKRDAARERFANYILPTLKDPLEVWLTRYDDGSYRRRFIALFEESKRQSLVIARENRDGSLMFNFVPVRVRGAYLDSQRKGFLLYRRNSAGDDDGA